MLAGVLCVACSTAVADSERPVLFVDDSMLERLKQRVASGGQP